MWRCVNVGLVCLGVWLSVCSSFVRFCCGCRGGAGGGLPKMDPASHALLHSRSVPNAARVLSALPTRPQLKIPSAVVMIILRRRVRVPLPTYQCTCSSTNCRKLYDRLLQ